MNDYEILDVDKNVSVEEVRRAFKRKALKLHPDKGGDPAEYKKVKDAYERILANMTKALANLEDGPQGKIVIKRDKPEIYKAPQERVTEMPDHRLENILGMFDHSQTLKAVLLSAGWNALLLLGFLLTSKFPEETLGIPGNVWQAFFLLIFILVFLVFLAIIGHAFWQLISGQDVVLLKTKKKIIDAVYNKDLLIE